jgi:hypothetical protein
MLLSFLILYEVIIFLIIYRLWTSKIRPGVIERCLLSAVLLVPLIGWPFYVFFRTAPAAHGEDVGDQSSGGGVGDTGYY